MNIIIGHANMDLDCLGSIVLAKYLYPGYVAVKSRIVHPVVKNVLNLYKKHLDLEIGKSLTDQHVEKIVIVDTRSRARVKEFFDYFELTSPDPEIIIYDHHVSDTLDIEGAELISEKWGANVSLMVRELKKREIHISPEDATIAMTGLYGDTGSFSFENVSSSDFEAASWLLSMGANLKLVKKFMQPLKEEAQLSLFHQVMNRLTYKKIHGHYILCSYIEIPKQTAGIGGVVEKVFDIESPDAFFLMVGIEKTRTTLMIARSQKERINVCSLLKPYGGGGHALAASAKRKKVFGERVLEEFIWYLRASLVPSVSAGQLMTHDVGMIYEDWTLMDASKFLEGIMHTGAPVIDREGYLKGVLTLRDISKGRKGNQMHSPVKSYMSRKITTFREDSSIREMEEVFLSKNIGHIPVVESERVVGIVTRQDFLDYIQHRQ